SYLRLLPHLTLHCFPTPRSSDLECQCEQEPDPASRVTLASDRDALGMPRIRLDWRVTDLTRSTIRHMAQLAAEQFAGSGLGNVIDRKSTRLNSSHGSSSYAVFCL